jgi:hypothetical protein
MGPSKRSFVPQRVLSRGLVKGENSFGLERFLLSNAIGFDGALSFP